MPRWYLGLVYDFDGVFAVDDWTTDRDDSWQGLIAACYSAKADGALMSAPSPERGQQDLEEGTGLSGRLVELEYARVHPVRLELAEPLEGFETLSYGYFFDPQVGRRMIVGPFGEREEVLSALADDLWTIEGAAQFFLVRNKRATRVQMLGDFRVKSFESKEKGGLARRYMRRFKPTTEG